MIQFITIYYTLHCLKHKLSVSNPALISSLFSQPSQSISLYKKNDTHCFDQQYSTSSGTFLAHVLYLPMYLVCSCSWLTPVLGLLLYLVCSCLIGLTSDFLTQW